MIDRKKFNSSHNKHKIQCCLSILNPTQLKICTIMRININGVDIFTSTHTRIHILYSILCAIKMKFLFFNSSKALKKTPKDSTQFPFIRQSPQDTLQNLSFSDDLPASFYHLILFFITMFFGPNSRVLGYDTAQHNFIFIMVNKYENTGA